MLGPTSSAGGSGSGGNGTGRSSAAYPTPIGSEAFAPFDLGEGSSTMYSMSNQGQVDSSFDFDRIGPDPPTAYNPFVNLGFGGNLNGTNFGFTNLQNHPQQSQPIPQTSIFPQYNSLDIPIEQTFDFSMLDPSFMDLVNSFGGDAFMEPDPFAIPTNQPQQSNGTSHDSRVSPNWNGQENGETSQEPIEVVDDQNAAFFEMFTNSRPPDSQQTHSSDSVNNLHPTNDYPYNETSGISATPRTVPPSQSASSGPFSSAPSSIPSLHPSDIHTTYAQAPISSIYTPLVLPENVQDTFSGSIEPSTNAIGLNATYDSPAAALQQPRTKTRTFGLAMASRSDAKGLEQESKFDNLPLVGGWFDAADLPTVARDHL